MLKSRSLEIQIDYDNINPAKDLKLKSESKSNNKRI
eukprot:SAG11_NODE_1450_length_4883_cov_2.373955_1_plen_36_part_00